MKKILFIFLAVVMVGVSVTTASAATVALFDWGFNINGTVYSQSAPASVNMASFDTATGLGTISWTTTGTLSNKFIAFFDHEMVESTNTFFNEFGKTGGTPASGQSWQIDEPGYVFGTIWNNVQAGILSNTNSVPDTAPDDVSMALGWDFTLKSYQTAVITLNIGQTEPTGFYLSHTDPDSSNYTIYYSGDLGITGRPPQVPIPGAVWLLGSGLAGLIGWRWRRKA